MLTAALNTSPTPSIVKAVNTRLTRVKTSAASSRKTMSAPEKTVSRFEARITPELHAMLKRAAQIQGRTMTDFAIDALQSASNKAIEQAEVIRLCREDQIAFANSLLNPPPMNAALKQAFENRDRLFTSDV